MANEGILSVATMVNGNLVAPPPFIYAPIILAEIICHGLVMAGHKVDYFGPMGTKISNDVGVQTLGLEPLAKTEDEYQAAIMNPAYGSHMRLGVDDLYLAGDMYEKAAAGSYDVLHFHHLHIPNALARYFPGVPSVTTIHDPISADDRMQIERSLTPNSFFVAISETQRLAAPDLPYAGTVYNGIDTDYYRPLEDVSEKDEYLLWAARIVPEKGLEDAIEVALATGRQLRIAGPKYKGTLEYFDAVVGPHLYESSPIRYLGVLTPEQIVNQMQHAYAFLMPIKWEEPFGLTVVEAMSCGTPVIAYNRGAMSEIIVDGQTGFLVNTIEEMTAAVERVKTINPIVCRSHVEQKFSLQAMTDGYVAAYRMAISRSK
jgi:glycosyltransferase involved in cell wall biosynthesis